jgi:hypothetical protein
MDLLDLKSADSPVSGTAASVGDCDDLEVCFCDPVNYAVRKSPEDKLPRAVQVHGPSLGTSFDLIDGMIELGHESNCGGRISLEVPPIAALASAMASGWSLALGAATGSPEDLAARHRPGNRLYFSLV